MERGTPNGTDVNQAGLDTLRADVAELRDTLSRLVKDVGAVSRSGVSSAAREAGAVAGEVRDWTIDRTATLRETVRTQPLTACTVALVAGAALGALIQRRH